jgi:hypothetical protein
MRLSHFEFQEVVCWIITAPGPHQVSIKSQTLPITKLLIRLEIHATLQPRLIFLNCYLLHHEKGLRRTQYQKHTPHQNTRKTCHVPCNGCGKSSPGAIHRYVQQLHPSSTPMRSSTTASMHPGGRVHAGGRTYSRCMEWAQVCHLMHPSS